MNTKPIEVMLVGHNLSLAQQIRASLASELSRIFHVSWVREMEKSTVLMDSTHIDIILLDLSLSNGRSADFVEQLLQHTPSAIIILLYASCDKVFAMQAMAKGAYDCLDKDRLKHQWGRQIVGYSLMLAKVEKIQAVSEARLQAIGNATSLGIVVVDLLGNVTYTNPVYQDMTGLSAGQSLGQPWAAPIHVKDRLRLEREWRQALQIQETFHSELRLTRQDHTTCRVRMTGTFIRNEHELFGHVRMLEELTTRNSDSLMLSAQFNHQRAWLCPSAAQLTIDVMHDAVLSTDVDGKVVYLNHAAQRLTGWNIDEVEGCVLADVLKLKDLNSANAEADSSALSKTDDKCPELSRDCVLVRKDGIETIIQESATPIMCERGNVIGAVVVFRDVTESRVSSMKMTHLAQHDALTGLPNRLLLLERLEQAIKLAKRHDTLLALLYVDIDFFKKINDAHGHEVGDKLLCSVAKRITEAVRETDTVCRQGGDEFVLLLSEISHPNDAAALSSKLLASQSTPYVIEGRYISVSLSIGIAIFPSDGDESQLLMSNADSAMFHAKSSGRNGYQFFKQSMHLKAWQHISVEIRIKRALLKNEFFLHYQPQYDLQSGEMIGAEALIRWQDPDLGLIYPADFIAIAERSSLIYMIGEWVRWQVCQQQQRWLDKGLDIVPVTVNTAGAELSQPHFFHNIEVVLKACGLASWSLGLEISERDMTPQAYPLIQRLKGLGLKLVLDNFGSAAGHLNYMQYLSFDSVKIAPELVYAAVTETGKAIIARAVMGLGKSLGQHIIAKGIENQGQLAFLEHSDCSAAQGYYFNPPLAAEPFAQLLGLANVEQVADI